MMPVGYRQHTRHSPLTAPWEPLFARETPNAIQLALEIREAHCNSRGFAHGGLISALADNAMGYSAVRQARTHEGTEKVSAVTVSLAVDFIDVARVGDCLEFQPTLLKVGRTLAFVDCRVVCGERLIARASASFRMG
ncbi:PaaI family thioesterase [Rhodoferax sp. UBA5149]|uniref:PaaI family thioesterase n=1 Tax=Rhodoferax sp. UBA5149 TaxID=1947379 RepID=UPI0025E57106|nr:PaaI family thioesterase [Rhodoferax sp. UBA5149]